jgi:hypothetical protein
VEENAPELRRGAVIKWCRPHYFAANQWNTHQQQIAQTAIDT